MLERLFHVSEHGSTVRTEVLAGITTFATMAYIVVVNPAILEFAGIPVGPGTVATAITAAFGCLLMAFYANRPFAVAPYMGENAFLAFGLGAMAVAVSWQERLGAVFVAGLLFLVLTLFGARQWLTKAISSSMKSAFAVGIGLFMAFVGLYQTGIVVSGAAGMPAAGLQGAGGLLRNPDVPVKIGQLGDPKVLLGIVGFVLIVVLIQRRITGAILIGLAVVGIGSVLLGLAPAPARVFATPFVGEYSLSPVALHMDLTSIARPVMLPVVLTLVLMAFLDTTGTLVGLGQVAGLADENGDVPEIRKPMIVDSLSCMFAGLVGTSTSGVFIESASGIREGGRTGLSTLVVALLFLASLFFIPLLQPLQQLGFVYGPVLIVVGLMMMAAVRGIDFEDATEAVPAFATVAMMVFTYNIANGLTAGLVLYPLMKLVSGRGRQVHLGSWVLGGLCAVYFVWGLKH